MYTITPNSHRAQAESATLLSSLELSVQLLTAIRKENLTIYQYRPSVTFEKKEGSDIEYVRFSYAYKYNSVTPGVYPAFVSLSLNKDKQISKAIREIVTKIIALRKSAN